MQREVLVKRRGAARLILGKSPITLCERVRALSGFTHGQSPCDPAYHKDRFRSRAMETAFAHWRDDTRVPVFDHDCDAGSHGTARSRAERFCGSWPPCRSWPPPALRHSRAERPSIGRLIAEAKARPTVSARIAFISRALLGARYRANTLIGGPRRKEVLVVRDDAFDCVTFCEVVLAAARARDLTEFEASLRRIRYAHGDVKWDERNHYFADWSRRAVENGICRPVAIEPSVTIEKTVNWRNLGKRHVSLSAIPRATLMANRTLLASGDVIGFVSAAGGTWISITPGDRARQGRQSRCCVMPRSAVAAVVATTASTRFVAANRRAIRHRGSRGGVDPAIGS